MVQYEGFTGTSPSGKAPGFGPGIRRFDPCRPSQIREKFRIAARQGGFWVGNRSDTFRKLQSLQMSVGAALRGIYYG